MWVCVKPNLTKCGWVSPGRVVDDADPMLEDAEPGCWERIVVEGGDYAPVEEATAEPGKVRRTGRKGAQ